MGLLVEGDEVDRALVERWLEPHAAPQPAADVVLQPADPLGSLVGRSLADVERELIERTLEHCGGNRKRTAETLGIGVRTLFNKLREPAVACS